MSLDAIGGLWPNDGAIVEMTIWEVPEPVPGSAHRLKYSLSTAIRGGRVVSYGKERGKAITRISGI